MYLGKSKYDEGIEYAPFPQVQAIKYPAPHIVAHIAIVHNIIIFFIILSFFNDSANFNFNLIKSHQQ